MGIEAVDTSEMYKLRAMLEKAGFRYEDFEEPYKGGATIKMPNHAEWIRTYEGVSVIQSWISNGGLEGKLEVWIKPDMVDPIGWLTAEEAFELIKEASDKEHGRWRY